MPTHHSKKLSKLTVLIVLLVTTFIVIVGTIWQIKTTHKIRAAFNNKIATILANDIINRMYLNYPEFIKGKNSIYIKQFDSKQSSLIEQFANYSCEYELDGCNPLTIAANDLAYWQQSIQDNLPNATGKLLWIESNNSIFVRINWKKTHNSKKIKSYTTKILCPSNSNKSINSKA